MLVEDAAWRLSEFN